MSNELVESLLTSTAEREAVENAPSQQSVDESEDDETLTAPQRAVQLLQAEYAARLDPEDMVDAFDIMADTITAKVLLVIKAGSLRDMWLRQRIRKVRESEQGA
ncbi:hypothetical protein PHYBOEH_010384 [Phytophthora boehmeriae]|uniref:Uncharacterized protein n=1 Tax=Phytophthora boehmeriae TaxID=109152 RepID=A0A8T1VR27_9STRA|nr:hypothetical protein PHYBOEH_010384 [Phytophthora boehmeriae]